MGSLATLDCMDSRSPWVEPCFLWSSGTYAEDMDALVGRLEALDCAAW